MDDVLSGGHDLESTLTKQQDLIEICKVGGFPLHKWLANHDAIIQSVDDVDGADSAGLEFEDNSYIISDLTWTQLLIPSLISQKWRSLSQVMPKKLFLPA